MLVVTHQEVVIDTEVKEFKERVIICLKTSLKQEYMRILNLL